MEQELQELRAVLSAMSEQLQMMNEIISSFDACLSLRNGSALALVKSWQD